MKKILFALFYPFLSLPTFFLNRYWMPEINNYQILPYKRTQTQITIQPFVMSADQANPALNKSDPSIYELDGLCSLANLNQTYLLQNKNNTTLLPSEWTAYNYYVPIRLNGKINATGIGWNIGYEVTEGCSIGWSSGFSRMTGAINLQPQEESGKYKLKEGMILQINEIYNIITKNLGLINNYSQFNNFSDQNFYIKFEFCRDYSLAMRKIKFSGQLGGIVPTAHTTSPSNPADIPGGTNGFGGLYGALNIDLLLKEDVNINLEGKLVYLNSASKTVRTRKWFESNRFGGYIGDADILPGVLYNFSPTITVEGLRKGLGCKINYSTWGQTESRYAFHNPNDLIQQVQMNIEAMTKWNQEHCNITLFYDFSREQINPTTEKYMAFSADIPVNFIFANNSAKSLAISFIFQVLY
jgi:hypothetical protein